MAICKSITALYGPIEIWSEIKDAFDSKYHYWNYNYFFKGKKCSACINVPKSLNITRAHQERMMGQQLIELKNTGMISICVRYESLYP